MLNILSTDLIVIEESKVVKSYYDIINRDDVKVIFIKDMDENNFFKNAPDGSDELKIWEKR